MRVPLLAWTLALITVVVIVAVALPLPASAATATFNPTADAIANEASPTANTGTSTALRVDGGTDPDVQTFLRFSVSGLSGTVQSATLRLWATSPTANGPSVFTTASTWTETGLTWNNRTALSGSGVGKVTNIATSTWAEFDVSSIVTGNGTYDLVLAGTSTDGVDFQSREATNKPQLVLTTQTGSDTTPPSDPTNLTATANGSNRIDLSWTASTDNVGVTNYEIRRDGSTLTTIGNVTTYADTNVAPSTSYTYTVRALDAQGNQSGFSNNASATTAAGNDTTNPSTPTDLAAVAQSATRIHLTWTASTDNVGVTNYEIVRDGVSLTTVGAVTSYDDDTVVASTTYAYRIRALDAAGNASGLTAPVSATTPPGPGDTTAPSNPTNLMATAATNGSIGLSWTASTDNVGVTNYEIVRNGSLLALVGAVTTYTDAATSGGTTYAYKVRALDAAGNTSGYSNDATATSIDTQAPSAPTNLAATPVSSTRIDLQWTASTDNVSVSNYLIYRGGLLLTTVGAVTTFSDTTATPGATYSYQVKARDPAGNTSAFSNTAAATTPQGSITLIPTADARVEEANASSNFGTVSPLRVDGGTGTHVESYLTFTASGLTGTVRRATLRLYALSGTVDGPTVAPTSTGWSETGITWANKPAPTGQAVADLGAITTGTWVDIDVTALVTGNGSYGFQLSGQSTDGVDFHSKEATNRPQLVITTGAPDTQAPSAPSNLAASAASPTVVNLTWNPSTDDVAVSNYLVYRGTTLLATLGSTAVSYTDSTVSGGQTYSYTVKARDAAGNVSGASNTATVTTPSSGGSVAIAAAGDIACATTDANYNSGNGTATACRQKATSNLIVNGGYAAVLALGDNQYNSGSLSQFQASYDPTWGRFKSITHPAVGNHEYGTSNASGYFSYYGASAGDPSKGYYSFDVGSWHLISLNSNCTIVACTNGSAQETWLRNDLATHSNFCTLAFDHHARWSSGHDGDNTFMQPMWQDLYDANADLFLSGHSHNYERFAPQNASGGLDNTRGIRQFVVGTGGAFFTGVGSAHANSQVRNNDTYGILKLTLRSTGYDWQFVPEAGKTFTDSGSTACH